MPLQPENPMNWAITVGQLKALKQEVIKNYKDKNPQNWSFYDLNTHFLKPFLTKPECRMGAGKECGYAVAINGDSPKTANRMISHAWGENFFEFVDTMAENFPDTEAIWVCTFALHQTDDQDIIARQVGTAAPSSSPFAKVIEATKKTTIFVSCGGLAYGSEGSVTKKVTGNVWSRLWCVYELFYSAQQNAEINMICSPVLTNPTHLPTDTNKFRTRAFVTKSGKSVAVGPVELSQMLHKTLIDKIDTANAGCSDANDKTNIDDEIKRSGGFAKVDQIAHDVRLGAIRSLFASSTGGSKDFYRGVLDKL